MIKIASKETNSKKNQIKIYYGGKIPNSSINKTIDNYKQAHHINISGPIPMFVKNGHKSKILEARHINRVDSKGFTRKKIGNISQEQNINDSSSNIVILDGPTEITNEETTTLSEQIPRVEKKLEPAAPAPAPPPPNPLPELVVRIMENHWFPMEKVPLAI